MDEAAAGGDVREQYRLVFRFVRRRSRSDADAEDVTQEVFLDAAVALERCKPGSPPGLAWLYTVAQRRLVDAARRTARRQELGGDAALELVPVSPSEYGSSVAAAVELGLRALPLLQRQVVTLKLLQGRSFAEIAEATRSSEGACRMRFVRGLEQLRDILEEEGIVP